MLRRLLPILFAAFVAVGVPVGAGAAVATEFPDTAPTTPAPTEPPPATEAPAGPATTTPATPESDDGSGTDWLPIVLIIGGVVVLLVALVALLGRNKQPAPAAHAPRPPTAPSPQANLLSTAQWVHDQLTLELMAAVPANAAQRWATERSRLDNVAIGAQQEFAAGNDPNWQPLGQTMSSLAVAIDTNLTLRVQQPPNAQLISESNDVVNRNRATLQQLIYLLRPTITR